MPEVADFLSLVSRRESCRDFDPQRRPTRAQLEQMVQTACLSPSARNTQPWHFTVVTQPEVVKQVAGCLQKMGANRFTENCPAFVVITQLSAGLLDVTGKITGALPFAPIDIGLATVHLCLSATAQGLSTCIMGWMDEKKLESLLHTPKNARIRLVVGVGFARTQTLREKNRRPAEQSVTWVE